MTKIITVKNNYSRKYITVEKTFNNKTHFKNWCNIVEKSNKIIGILETLETI